MNGLENFNTSSLLKLIANVLISEVVPQIPIPTAIIAMGVKSRPGLSAIKISEHTLMGCTDIGIPMGDLFGEENLFAKSLQITQETMVDGITQDAVVDSVTQPGDNRSYVTTVGLSGPQTGQGINLLPIKNQGIIT